MVDNDWKYKSDEDLMKILTNAQVDFEKKFITCCGSGLTAAMISYSSYLLGKNDGYLYDRSWAEYGKIE